MSPYNRFVRRSFGDLIALRGSWPMALRSYTLALFRLFARVWPENCTKGSRERSIRSIQVRALCSRLDAKLILATSTQVEAIAGL